MKLAPSRTCFSRGLAALVSLALGFTLLGADCDGDLVNDPTFRDWCGVSLCAWKTDSGRIAQAPTWSADDLGVAFVAPGTEISQATSESAATCILFTTVASFDATAEMQLSVDFDSDGTIDQTFPLPAVTWEKTQVLITAPGSYDGITFYVKKGGDGPAVLAEMRIQESSGCSGAAPDLVGLKLGELCGAHERCGAGLTCTTNAPWFTGTCGECSPDDACAGGLPCERRAENLPLQCAPGRGQGKSLAPCLADDDCASGTCVGVSGEADGGRADLEAGVTHAGGTTLTGAPCALDGGASDASAGCYAKVAGAVAGTCR